MNVMFEEKIVDPYTNYMHKNNNERRLINYILKVLIMKNTVKNSLSSEDYLYDYVQQKESKTTVRNQEIHWLFREFSNNDNINNELLSILSIFINVLHYVNTFLYLLLIFSLSYFSTSYISFLLSFFFIFLFLYFFHTALHQNQNNKLIILLNHTHTHKWILNLSFNF